MRTKKPNKIRRGLVFRKALGITVLALLMLVSIAGAAPYAYITNGGSNTVSVIDTATNSVTATVPVGSSPYGAAVNSDGTKVYVTCDGNPGTVYVIDTSTNKVMSTVPFGPDEIGGFRGVAVSPDGTKVYATNSFKGLYIIDTAIDKFIEALKLAPKIGILI